MHFTNFGGDVQIVFDGIKTVPSFAYEIKHRSRLFIYGRRLTFEYPQSKQTQVLVISQVLM